MNVEAVNAAEVERVRETSRVRALPRDARFADILKAYERTNPQAAALSTTSSLTPSAVHTVQSGESMWKICADALAAQGKGGDHTAISQAVDTVAKANGLSDASRLKIGQTLDLSALGAFSRVSSTSSVQSAQTKAASLLTSSSQGGPTARRIPTSFREASTAARQADLAVLMRGIIALRARGAYTEKSGEKPNILETAAEVTSEFGFRKDPFTGRRQHHDGIDLAVPSGTKVYPLKSGEVVTSGRGSGYGNMVVVRHGDGAETVYAHLSSNSVQVGQKVSEKTVLGLSGSTGRSTGPHLHFEVRIGGQPINPRPFIPAGSIQVAKAS